jgi:hypothetical protein
MVIDFVTVTCLSTLMQNLCYITGLLRVKKKKVCKANEEATYVRDGLEQTCMFPYANHTVSVFSVPCKGLYLETLVLNFCMHHENTPTKKK